MSDNINPIDKAASEIVAQPDDGNRFHKAVEKLKEAYQRGRREARNKAEEQRLADLPQEGSAAVD